MTDWELNSKLGSIERTIERTMERVSHQVDMIGADVRCLRARSADTDSDLLPWGMLAAVVTLLVLLAICTDDREHDDAVDQARAEPRAAQQALPTPVNVR